MEFTLSERDRRYRAVRDAMEPARLDALLVYGTTGVGGRWNGNYVYLAERCLFYGEALLYFPLSGDPVLFISGENQYLEARRTRWIEEIRLTRQPGADLAAHLAARHGARARIGVSSFAGLPAAAAAELRARCPEVEFIEAGELVLTVRGVKSAEELAVLRRAAALGDAGLRRSLEILRPGLSERDWRAELEAVMTRGGADGGFNMLSAGRAEGAEDPFRGFVVPPSERSFRRGDLVLLEISPRVMGYWNQVVRLVALGQPPEPVRRAHAACLAAKRAALERLRPGETFASASRALDQELGRHGYAMKSVGSAHTIGLDLSESIVNLDNAQRVAAGCAVTLHPMVATGDWRQLFVGETYFVHPDGVEALNRCDESLAVLD